METILSPRIQSYCQQCSSKERRIALAYCSYLAYADRQLRHREVEFIRALADAAGETEDLLLEYARKARQRKLKIHMPGSQVGRSLLFQVALAVAAIDGEVDPRERRAIDRLAELLGLSPEIVDIELGEIVGRTDPPATTPPVANNTDRVPPTEPKRSSEGQSFWGQILDFFTNQIVIEDYEAKLYRAGESPPGRKVGEIEFSRTKGGRVEVEVELKRLGKAQRKPLAIFLNGSHFRDVLPAGDRFEETLVFDAGDDAPAISPGMIAELRQGDDVLYEGRFVVD